MAQPNVAREPSMEEILASIRRIIESNEPETTSNELARLAAMEVEETGSPAPTVEDIRLTIEDDLPSFIPPRPPVQAAAPQNQPVERPAAAPVARPLPQPMAATVPPVAANESNEVASPARRDEEPRSISLADVAARVRAASERNETVRPIVASAEAARPVEMRAQPMIRTIEPVAAPSEPAFEPTYRNELEALSEQAVDFRIEEHVAEIEHELASEPTLDQAPEMASEQKGALVSRETGDHVARSFHELADMVHMSAQRSLDDIAGEMLRPMLQEWLDDNLPTLVERLVREEIERVARGPRR